MTTRTTIPDPREQPTPPPDVAQLLQQAGDALHAGRASSAIATLKHALTRAPDAPGVLRLLGIATLLNGDRAGAVGHLRRAVALAPNDAAIHMSLGSALFESDAVDEGLAALRRACALAPRCVEAWYNLGTALAFTCFTLQRVDHMEQARDAFKHALAIDPGHLKTRIKLAEVLIALGDMPAAGALLRDTLAREPDCIDAWVALRNLKTEHFGSADVAELQRLLQRPDAAEDARIALGFTLAKALEDIGEYAAAFDALNAANASRHAQEPWDRAQERARVRAVEQAFMQPLRAATDPRLGSGIIFVVCLPRSGATLTEQILASHYDVQAGGETGLLIDILRDEHDRRGGVSLDWVSDATAADWQRLGERYLERAQALRDHHLYFTDKSVDNWACAAAALAMLPGARIVNCRRDPLENCFACYRQLFPVGGDFTYDLDDMVAYYAGYERLSALWRSQFPERWRDFDYEALQQDTEGEIRRLLDFCGLPFDADCLAFHRARRVVLTMSASQVREPIRHDTARGPLYGALLNPLQARLLAAAIPWTRLRPAALAPQGADVATAVGGLVA